MAFHQTYKTYKASLRAESASDQVLRSGRRFGTFTFLSGLVRFYAAYQDESRELYVLTMWTYGIRVVHFGAEWLVFGVQGMEVKRALAVSTGTLGWMLVHSYLQGGAGLAEKVYRKVYIQDSAEALSHHAVVILEMPLTFSARAFLLS